MNSVLLEHVVKSLDSYPVFPGSNTGCSKVYSASHPTEDGEMSSCVIITAQVRPGCADLQRFNKF